MLEGGKMDYAKLKEAKKIYESMIHFFGSLESRGLYRSPLKNVPLAGIMAVDLGSFMLYLSASDGSIDSDEVEAYRYITGRNVSGRDMVNLISKNRIYSESFESRVPMAMEIAVNSKIKFADGPNEIPLAVLLFEFYKKLGVAMVTANNAVADNEKRDFNTYLNTVANYLARNGYRVS